MSKVLVFASMSLDGYVAGPDVSADHPMGVGGERLHDWMFTDPALPDRAVTDGVRAETGAVVVGRRTFDVGLRHWEDVPYPAPTFVVTHETRPDLPQAGGTFSFLAGVEAAVERAKTAAGERTVTLMGADVQRQALAAGLVDEVRISLVPVLLGGGAKLFDGLPAMTFSGPVGQVSFAVR
ncbi:MAG: dihydrofolate reductase family protein [Actinophytocola sp.]|uniref:dihydrofolate reductase family protein n=1 Tax=Actinophytocola sp. TaxID=1872138 RepID=UPI003C7632F3